MTLPNIIHNIVILIISIIIVGIIISSTFSEWQTIKFSFFSEELVAHRYLFDSSDETFIYSPDLIIYFIFIFNFLSIISIIFINLYGIKEKFEYVRLEILSKYYESSLNNLVLAVSIFSALFNGLTYLFGSLLSFEFCQPQSGSCTSYDINTPKATIPAYFFFTSTIESSPSTGFTETIFSTLTSLLLVVVIYLKYKFGSTNEENQSHLKPDIITTIKKSKTIKKPTPIIKEGSYSRLVEVNESDEYDDEDEDDEEDDSSKGLLSLLIKKDDKHGDDEGEGEGDNNNNGGSGDNSGSGGGSNNENNGGGENDDFNDNTSFNDGGSGIQMDIIPAHLYTNNNNNNNKLHIKNNNNKILDKNRPNFQPKQQTNNNNNKFTKLNPSKFQNNNIVNSDKYKEKQLEILNILLNGGLKVEGEIL